MSRSLGLLHVLWIVSTQPSIEFHVPIEERFIGGLTSDPVLVRVVGGGNRQFIHKSTCLVCRWCTSGICYGAHHHGMEAKVTDIKVPVMRHVQPPFLPNPDLGPSQR
ncbi:hypothetical protein LY76DRAFT_590758 [Colletotrichum caudatum]|nr:hypothetical protein LY76DRAFT_590758 [Colletotrichum caudatum]